MYPTHELSRLTVRRQIAPRFTAAPVGVLVGFALVVSALVGVPAGAASAASAPAPSVPGGFTITKSAAPAPAGASNCDDLAFLDGHLFLGCQNKTLSVGGGGNSTLIEYTPAGAVVNTWSITDKNDGMGADPP